MKTLNTIWSALINKMQQQSMRILEMAYCRDGSRGHQLQVTKKAIIPIDIINDLFNKCNLTDEFDTVDLLVPGAGDTRS